MTVSILQGDALAVLQTLPSDHFHCVVTSPPYWGLRDYGVDGQIGLEETPDEWCARLVEVFREVRRVLRSDGVCFVNIGDSYCAAQGGRQSAAGKLPINLVHLSADFRERDDVQNGSWSDRDATPTRCPPRASGLKPKDLVGQPWMLAFALRADGWWLRSEIIWAKPNPMPESVRDRPTKAHEQVFLLTKSARYYYDAEAVKEPAAYPDGPNSPQSIASPHGQGFTRRATEHRETFRGGCYVNGKPGTSTETGNVYRETSGRNLRSVWTIATEPLPSIIVDGEKLDHFASYPIELARRCILAGTSAKGRCPECGAPWARVVEREFEPQGDVSPQRGVRGHSGQKSMDASSSWQGFPRGTTNGTTAGWRPTCSCDAGAPEPCRVLDPFGGSGRTALAAEELGRDATLIELNPASIRMAQAQLEYAKARRMIGDAERVPVPAAQMSLGL